MACVNIRTSRIGFCTGQHVYLYVMVPVYCRTPWLKSNVVVWYSRGRHSTSWQHPHNLELGVVSTLVRDHASFNIAKAFAPHEPHCLDKLVVQEVENISHTIGTLHVKFAFVNV